MKTPITMYSSTLIPIPPDSQPQRAKAKLPNFLFAESRFVEKEQASAAHDRAPALPLSERSCSAAISPDPQ